MFLSRPVTKNELVANERRQEVGKKIDRGHKSKFLPSSRTAEINGQVIALSMETRGPMGKAEAVYGGGASP